MEDATIITRAIELSDSQDTADAGIRRAFVAVLWARGAHETVKMLARVPYDPARQVAERKAMAPSVRAYASKLALAVGAKVVREGDARRDAAKDLPAVAEVVKKQEAKIKAAYAGKAGGLAIATDPAVGWAQAAAIAEAKEDTADRDKLIRWAKIGGLALAGLYVWRRR